MGTLLQGKDEKGPTVLRAAPEVFQKYTPDRLLSIEQSHRRNERIGDRLFYDALSSRDGKKKLIRGGYANAQRALPMFPGSGPYRSRGYGNEIAAMFTTGRERGYVHLPKSESSGLGVDYMHLSRGDQISHAKNLVISHKKIPMDLNSPTNWDSKYDSASFGKKFEQSAAKTVSSEAAAADNIKRSLFKKKEIEKRNRRARLLGAGALALAGTAAAVYGGKKLYDRYKDEENDQNRSEGV